MTDWTKVMDEYLSWIKDNTVLKTLASGEGCEIYSPFLDRHNDHLAIYILKTTDNNFKLTDDGYIINDLEMSGMEFSSDTRKKFLSQALNAHGINKSENGELYVNATWTEIAKKKHSLLQAMIAINDLFTLSKESVHNLFREDLYLLFTSNNIPIVNNIPIPGKSGFAHTIDFVIAERHLLPEIRVKALNNPTKQTVESTIFAFSDISSSNERSGSNLVVYNDLDNPITNSSLEAFSKYGIEAKSFSDMKSHVLDYA